MEHDLNKIKDFVSGKRILLVGNAKSLQERKMGNTIDSYDVVVRFNIGTTHVKRKEWLGTKTDIWSQTLKEDRYLAYKESFDKVDFILCLLGHLPSIDYFPEDDRAILGDENHFIKVAKRTGTKFPSTGLMTADFFVKELDCKDVSCIGFDFFKTPTWYWSAALTQIYKEKQSHVGRIEEKYIKESLGVKVL